MVDGIEQTGGAIVNPVLNILYSFFNALPGIIGAIIVVIIGYLVALLFGSIAHRILVKFKLDDYMKKHGLAKGIGHTSLSQLVGAIIKWYVFIIFLGEAVALLNFGILSTLLANLINWMPNLIVAIIIVLFGLVVAQYIGDRMLKAKLWGIKLLTAVVKGVILFFIVVIAMNQLGLDVGILENTFLLIVAGIALGVALALGIGLGLGLKNEAEDLVKDLLKK